MAIKIPKQIGDCIFEKICISEMTTMIDRFIKGLEPLNMSRNELKVVLDLLKKLDGKPRIELADRPIMFNEFANKLNIELIKWAKKIILNIVE